MRESPPTSGTSEEPVLSAATSLIKKVNLEGDIVMDDKTGEPVPCPVCGHKDMRIFHSIGGVESQKSSSRGDTQVATTLSLYKSA